MILADQTEQHIQIQKEYYVASRTDNGEGGTADRKSYIESDLHVNVEEREGGREREIESTMAREISNTDI